MLELIEATKEFDVKMALDHVNIKFHEGEITGILGRNGSGKTTMLKAILNLTPLTSGKILLDGKAVYDQYDKVAFISEEGSFMPNMTVKEYGKFLESYYPSFDRAYYEELADQFDLHQHSPIKDFSKGQKMKAEIAAGFAMRAKLIILDEPFNGLDVYAKEDTVKLLIEQLHEDTIILISTHNIEEIEQVVDRCVIIRNSRIVKDIRMEELHERGHDLKELMDRLK